MHRPDDGVDAYSDVAGGAGRGRRRVPATTRGEPGAADVQVDLRRHVKVQRVGERSIPVVLGEERILGVAEPLERLPRVVRGLLAPGPREPRERDRDQQADNRDDQHDFNGGDAARGAHQLIGRITVKAVSPGVDLSVTVPSWRRTTMRRTMSSPGPFPDRLLWS